MNVHVEFENDYCASNFTSDYLRKKGFHKNSGWFEGFTGKVSTENYDKFLKGLKRNSICPVKSTMIDNNTYKIQILNEGW